MQLLLIPTIWLGLAILLSPPNEAEQRAEVTAEVYETWLPLAEALEAASLQRRVDRELATVHEVDGQLPTNLLARLETREQERRSALEGVIARHDPLRLVDEAPQTANFLADVVRLDIDRALSEDLMDRFEPLAGTPALHPTVFASLQSRLVAEELASLTAPADPLALASFNADLETWTPITGALGAARGRDQFIRAVFVPQLAELGADAGPFIAAFGPVIGSVDAQTTALAMDYLDNPGFEVIHTASPALSEVIASLVHHGGTDEERARLLGHIEPLALAGRFDGQRYALMYDRLAESQERPQRYGSQDACVNGQRTIYQLEDPDRVDEMRARFGMMPLDDYLQILIDQYGAEC